MDKSTKKEQTQSSLETILLACAGAKHPDGSYLFTNEVRLPCLGRSTCSDPGCGDSTWDHECDLGGHGVECCQNRTWVPSPDQDAWRRAVRALDGEVRIHDYARFPGAWVQILVGVSVGEVRRAEGLRDFPAFAEALKRVLERLPSVEMGT